jgi:hypothetical protein
MTIKKGNDMKFYSTRKVEQTFFPISFRNKFEKGSVILESLEIESSKKCRTNEKK